LLGGGGGKKKNNSPLHHEEERSIFLPLLRSAAQLRSCAAAQLRREEGIFLKNGIII
jgi:hypothetical protein